MNEQKLKILQMLETGKINSDEALKLINAIETDKEQIKKYPSPEFSKRFFRIKVDGDKTKVNVNIPLNLVKATSKLIGSSMQYIPEDARKEMASKGIDLSQIDIEELLRIIDEELIDGKIVDVDVDDPKEGKMKVDVYVE